MASTRRDQLLDAAVSVFSRKGYAATSVQEVADAAGIRKASVYKHIAAKEDLLFWILERAHEHTDSMIGAIRALDTPPLERLHEYLRRHVLWYLEHVDLMNVFFREWGSVTTPERRQLIIMRRRAYERFVRDLLSECRETGDANAALDVKLACFYLLGAVNATPNWYPRAQGDSAREVARDTADLAVGMIRATRPGVAA